MGVFLDSQINKATDGALTSDNWQYILDVCDTISTDPEKNIKESVKILKKRLAQKDANIVLRSLALLLAMGENCGSRMQQEIASEAFLKEALLSKLAYKKVHRELKVRVAEVIEQLDKSYKKDPSLKAVSDAYGVVKSKYSQYLKQPPSKPEKKTLTVQDRKNEDAEFERALRLSVQEYEREQNVRQSAPSGPSGGNHVQGQTQSTNSPFTNETPQNSQSGERGQNGQTSAGSTSNTADQDTVTIANVKKVVALYDLISYEPDELSFRKGDIITVMESAYRDWWRGSLANGKVGIFPLNYVTPVVSKTPEQLQRENKLESALIDTESKKVDRLLFLLSSDPAYVQEDEVTELYNSVVTLKPMLAQLIGKHSGRRDELMALNDQVAKETKLYNSSIDKMINQRQNPGYGVPYPSSQGQIQPQHSQSRVQAQTSAPRSSYVPSPPSVYKQPEQLSSPHRAPPHSQQGNQGNQVNQGNQHQQYQLNQQPTQPTQRYQQPYGQSRASLPQLEQQPTSAGFGNSSGNGSSHGADMRQTQMQGSNTGNQYYSQPSYAQHSQPPYFQPNY